MQYLHVSNHYVILLKIVLCYVNYISIKLWGKLSVHSKKQTGKWSQPHSLGKGWWRVQGKLVSTLFFKPKHDMPTCRSWAAPRQTGHATITWRGSDFSTQMQTGEWQLHEARFRKKTLEDSSFCERCLYLDRTRSQATRADGSTEDHTPRQQGWAGTAGFASTYSAPQVV